MGHLTLMQVPSGPPPGAGEHLAFVWYIVALLVFIVASVLFLLIGRRNRIEALSDKRVIHTEGLLKLNADELGKKEALLTKATDDLRETETELRVVAGVKIQELMDFWAKKESTEAHIANLESRNRALEGALAHWERGDNCHACIHSSQAPNATKR